MSNDIQKADQIAFHFYTKLFYVVNQARATAEPRTQGKVDKWFNLETPDSDLFTKEAKEPYKNISLALPSGPPPLEIQVVLSVPELANNQVLVHATSRTRIEPTPRFIVLERFVLSFTPRRADEDESIDVALPTIYKHGIPLFRSLYSLLRVLPAWKLYKRLKRRIGGGNGRNLGIQLRINNGSDRGDILELDGRFAIQTHTFSSVPHPLGSLKLSLQYLGTPDFQLEDMESVLSSRFISQDLDGGEGFVPTLTKNNHQRDSSISSMTRSPPKNIARAVSSTGTDVAERFILPARTASTGTAVQPPRQLATGDIIGAQSPSSGLAVSRLRKESLGSNHSPSSSIRDLPPSNPSLSSLSSSPSSGPMAIRRPNINPVHPFKSNTVLSSSTAGSSSSPSLSIRQGPLAGSPLSTGLAGSTHSRSASVSSSTVTNAATNAGPPRHPPSPIGVGFTNTARPSSPLFAPSSLSDRQPNRPGTSGSTGSGGSDHRDRRVSLGGAGDGVSSSEDNKTGRVTIPTRKRYSSSFGHRYTNSVGSGSGGGGASAEGGGGSSGTGTPAIPASGSGAGVGAGAGGTTQGVSGLGLGIENMRIAGGGGDRRDLSSSFLSTATDDDDISIFVQDIDARKPLSGRWKEREDKERRSSLGPAGRMPLPREDATEPRHALSFIRGQAHDRETSDTTIRQRQPLARDSTLSTIPSAPSSRFSVATGSSGGSSVTVTPSVIGGSAATVTAAPSSTSAASPGLSLSPTKGPMLTNQEEVEERLRKMNETFLKSLEGISTNEAKRKERERKRERERERERERRDRTSRQNSDEPSSPVSPSLAREADHSPSRGLSLRPAPPLTGERSSTTPTSTEAYNQNGRWTQYSLGMGLRRNENGSSSTTLDQSDAAASQGSEEVIGRMDLFEGPKSRAYQP